MSRVLALALCVATGFSGLVYEVAWQKYLAILLGSHSEATAAILGLFLAGLALGYGLFGGLTRRRVERSIATGRPARLLWLYGGVEACIGLWALVFPWTFAAVQALSLALPQGAGGAGFAIDVALSALLVLPPTLLMGSTIPLLTQVLARDLEHATRVHAWVYAFNTAGAFAGALAGGFWLIPRLGLDGTLFAMSAVNLAAGAVFALLERGESGPLPTGEPTSSDEAAGRALVAGYAAIAGLTGFAMMVLQNVMIRVGGLSFGSTPFTFSIVVAVFVLCIAVGSMLVSLLRGVRPGLVLANQWLLVLVAVLLYSQLEQLPYWAHGVRASFEAAPEFAAYQRASFLAVLAVLAPCVVLSGAALPLLFHQARRHGDALGATAGRLYAWNTVGSLFGSLLGGYALLYWLDLHGVYRVALLALLLGAAWLCLLLYGAAGRAPALIVAGLGALAILWLEPWDPRLLTSGLFRYQHAVPGFSEGPLAAAQSVRRGAKLVFHEDDPTATVSVNEWNPPGRGLIRSLLTNGKPDGTTTRDYPTMSLAGIIPALLAERAERAFVIGWGTGITAGELASLPSMREVVVAEISSGVLRAAPLFDFAALDASRNPRIQVLRSDAYRALLRTEGRFDVIVSEPSNPWMVGVEMLYSREFLEAARERLAPGGIYVQWYQQYETDRRVIELVLRTYTAVFDQVAVWHGTAPDLLVLGFQHPEQALDLESVERRAREPGFPAALARSGVPSVAALLAHEILPLGVVQELGLEGPLHTLVHPRLSFLAAEAFFYGRTGWLPFAGFGGAGEKAAANSLLRRHLEEAQGEERLSRTADAAREACRYRLRSCVPLLAEWQRLSPDRIGFDALVDENEQLFGGVMDPALVADVAELIAGGSERSVHDATTLAYAQRETARYMRYYHPAVDFAPERLLEIWRRCEHAEEPGRCETGHARTQRLLEEGSAALRQADRGASQPN